MALTRLHCSLSALVAPRPGGNDDDKESRDPSTLSPSDVARQRCEGTVEGQSGGWGEVATAKAVCCSAGGAPTAVARRVLLDSDDDSRGQDPRGRVAVLQPPPRSAPVAADSNNQIEKGPPVVVEDCSTAATAAVVAKIVDAARQVAAVPQTELPPVRRQTLVDECVAYLARLASSDVSGASDAAAGGCVSTLSWAQRYPPPDFGITTAGLATSSIVAESARLRQWLSTWKSMELAAVTADGEEGLSPLAASTSPFSGSGESFGNAFPEAASPAITTNISHVTDERGHRLSVRLARKEALERAKADELERERQRQRGYFSGTQQRPTTLAVIRGPTGVGKTSMVYRVAAEVGYRVLELNTSIRRSARTIEKVFAEATQCRQLRTSKDSAQLVQQALADIRVDASARRRGGGGTVVAPSGGDAAPPSGKESKGKGKGEGMAEEKQAAAKGAVPPQKRNALTKEAFDKFFAKRPAKSKGNAVTGALAGCSDANNKEGATVVDADNTAAKGELSAEGPVVVVVDGSLDTTSSMSPPFAVGVAVGVCAPSVDVDAVAAAVPAASQADKSNSINVDGGGDSAVGSPLSSVAEEEEEEEVHCTPPPARAKPKGSRTAAKGGFVDGPPATAVVTVDASSPSVQAQLRPPVGAVAETAQAFPLVLIESGDVVFGDEGGVYSAIRKLAAESKFPVVVTVERSMDLAQVAACFGSDTPCVTVGPPTLLHLLVQLSLVLLHETAAPSSGFTPEIAEAICSALLGPTRAATAATPSSPTARVVDAVAAFVLSLGLSSAEGATIGTAFTTSAAANGTSGDVTAGATAAAPQPFAVANLGDVRGALLQLQFAMVGWERFLPPCGPAPTAAGAAASAASAVGVAVLAGTKRVRDDTAKSGAAGRKISRLEGDSHRPTPANDPRQRCVASCCSAITMLGGPRSGACVAATALDAALSAAIRRECVVRSDCEVGNSLCWLLAEESTEGRRWWSNETGGPGGGDGGTSPAELAEQTPLFAAQRVPANPAPALLAALHECRQFMQPPYGCHCGSIFGPMVATADRLPPREKEALAAWEDVLNDVDDVRRVAHEALQRTAAQVRKMAVKGVRVGHAIAPWPALSELMSGFRGLLEARTNRLPVESGDA